MLPSSAQPFFLAWPRIVLLLVLCGCAGTPEVDATLSESPVRAVYLERITDRTFQAAHPIKLSDRLLTQVLRGIVIKDSQGLLTQFTTGASSLHPAFTEEEAVFLAPLISDGLARAASDQRIGFRMVQRGARGLSQAVGAGVGSSEPLSRLSAPEVTSGAVYAYGRSLYVTLREYRHRIDSPDTINMPNRRIPDRTGLATRTVLFVPESAKRPESYHGKDDGGETIAIDYELLATLPSPSAVPVSAGVHSAEPVQSSPDATDRGTDSRLRLLQEQMHQKDVELEELRKELRDIREQLTEPSTKQAPSRR